MHAVVKTVWINPLDKEETFAMLDGVLGGHPILRRDNYSMMDILNNCNCDYY